MTVISVQAGDAAHAQPGHPERPARMAAVRAALAADPGLADLARVAGEPASRAALERVHTPAYLDRLESVCAHGGGDLDADTYATPASLDVARQSCGNLLAVVDAVMDGEVARGFALGRPPGHHARPAAAMGFCLLSNAAVAARHAQARGAERVMVVDLDVHHGNGTEEAFFEDPSVLFVSSHQAGLYPGTGALADVGAGPGRGATVNLPVPAGTGDELAALYRDVLPPLAARFRPDLVVLSLGSDAHRLDPLAGLRLSVRGLADAATVVRETADAHAGGRVVGTLEGGYHVDAPTSATNWKSTATVAAVLRRFQDPAAEVADPFGPTSQSARDLGPLAEAVRQLHGL